MLDDVKEVCHEPIAEMASNGLADGWEVSHVRVADRFVGFTKGDICITYDGGTIYPLLRWHVMDSKARVGGHGFTLAHAIVKAKANGWPL